VLELRAQQPGDAGEDVDPGSTRSGPAGPRRLEIEAQNRPHLLGAELRAARQVCHAERGVRDPLTVVSAQLLLHPSIARERAPRACSDRRERDVVVRRPDAAGGEHEVGALAQAQQRLADVGGAVADDGHLEQADAPTSKQACEEVAVLVADLPREQLVADEQNGCGGCVGRHGATVAFLASFSCRP
jgi:hypothetical protein